MDQILREAELAEAAGFDGIWVPERRQRTETYWPSTISLLMALAARSRRVKLATTVLCLGSKQKWIDRIESYREQVNPDWICFHIRTPQDGRGYHPSFAEALECIEQFGEVLDAVPTES